MKNEAGEIGQLPFIKVHGAGNDCLVFETAHLPASLATSTTHKSALIRKLADRHLGVGCDQVLEIFGRAPLAIQVWNQDGSQAEMCGNGARAIAKLAWEKKWVSHASPSIPMNISGKNYAAQRLHDENFELALGEPNVDSAEELVANGHTFTFWPVNVGNPHAVIFWRAPDAPEEGASKKPAGFQFREWGPLLEAHPRFPKKTNVEFVSLLTKPAGFDLVVRAEVWERGAGATLSCGSGAIAVGAAARRYLQRDLVKVRVQMNQFELTARFEPSKGGKTLAHLSGPAEVVAEGVWHFRY